MNKFSVNCLNLESQFFNRETSQGNELPYTRENNSEAKPHPKSFSRELFTVHLLFHLPVESNMTLTQTTAFEAYAMLPPNNGACVGDHASPFR